jgi:hypothetical protein
MHPMCDASSHAAIIERLNRQELSGGISFIACISTAMIRKLKSGQFRLYSQKKNPETDKRRNLGTFSTLAQAKQHEREVQYFKRH